MSANINSNLANWSVTDASNQPDGADTADLDAEFQRMQSVVRKYLRTKGTDIASASTTDLSTADGDYMDVTGTATITSFGTVSAGMRFLLRFAGAVTITHNATSLILFGSNITTAAGDVAMLESLGSGNWKCLFYQKVSGAPLVTVAISSGGTGQTSQTAAFDALAPTTTQGDQIYHNGTDNVRAPKGTALQHWRMNAGATAPEWATTGIRTATGYTGTGGIVTKGARGSFTSLVVPADDTIPQRSETSPLVDVTISGTAAGSKIFVEAQAIINSVPNNNILVCIFRSDSDNALSIVPVANLDSGYTGGKSVYFEETSPGGDLTYQVRIGSASIAATVNYNRSFSSNDQYGTTMASFIRVTEELS